MAKIELAIREAIARGARREIRHTVRPLRREVRRLRRVLAQLRRDLAGLGDLAVQWRRAAGAVPWRPRVSEAEAKAARLSPRLIRTLRLRLGLSQTGLARLIGVSGAAVVQWEGGGAAPSGENRSALVGLRRLGRRDVKRILAAMPKAVPARRRPARGRRRKTRPRARR